MSLEYLSKYLVKDGSKPKKRKRESVRVVEDDLTGWDGNTQEENSSDLPQVVETTSASRRSAGFRPAYAEADVIKHDGTEPQASIPETQRADRLSTGARAGLQTKEQVASDAKLRREAQMEEFLKSESVSAGKERETVYRDATGRRIDITLARQEKVRELKREEERLKKERELTRGLVQQQEKAARKRELENVQSEGFSRYAGHADSENSMRVKQRWNDPAASFLTEKTDYSVRNGGAGQRPNYSGGFAPNRFGIRPGYRWDGVDRGNGFEATRFRELAKYKQRRGEYEDWAKADM